LSGAVELEIDQSRSLYTSQDQLFRLLGERGKENPAPFSGKFTRLSGSDFTVLPDGTVAPDSFE
jgi:hypothetical protein